MSTPAAPDSIKAHCPSCDGERTCTSHGTIHKPWEWSDDRGNSVNGGVTHSLLECKGCETVFYESSSWNTEDMDYWYDFEGATQSAPNYEKNTYPKPTSTNKPAWIATVAKIDGQLHDLLSQMYVALDNQSYILTAIGLRTALDRATELLGVEQAQGFDKKLQALKAQGFIGEDERALLEVVTDAGNAAAHRAWSPDAADIQKLLMPMEVFLQRAFIIGKGALALKPNIPARVARRSQSSQQSAPAPSREEQD